VGYSLAGLSLRSPQTEHFNAELPLPPELLGEARSLTGLDQALATSGHLAGSLALEFAPIAPGVVVESQAGEGGGYGTRFWGARALDPAAVWHGALFGGQHWLPGLDHGHNEAEAVSGGMHLQWRRAAHSFAAVGALQERDFGARGFYGVPADRAAWESTQDALLLGSWRSELSQPGDYIRSTATTRRFADDYILDAHDPSYYRNQHRTRASALAADGRASGSDRVALNWRLWGEDEHIDSHGVFRGAPTAGLGHHNRQRLGLMLLPQVTLGSLTLRGGGQTVWFSADSPELLALAGIEYVAKAGHVWYATCTQQVRQPSFTELDYESPASLGNAGLENQRSSEWEAGLRYSRSPRWKTRLALFRRSTRNTIDWVRLAPGGRWLATDLGEVATTGAETEAWCHVVPSLRVGGFAQWLSKDGSMDAHASRYVYNYAEERVTMAVAWSPVPWCELRTQQTVMAFAHNPARTSDRWGTDSSLALTVSPSRWPDVRFGVEVTNLFADDTQLQPGQKRSDQRLMGTVSARW
jgi:iron complex outermembrane receptor protein